MKLPCTVAPVDGSAPRGHTVNVTASAQVPAGGPYRRARRTAPLATAAPEPAFVVGTLDHGFLTVSRRDHFRAHAGTSIDRRRLHAYLTERPSEAVLLEWILRADGTPICTLRPDPAFGRRTYATLIEMLGDDERGNGTQRLSVPGTVSGRLMLLDGSVVHAVDPEHAGLVRWPGGTTGPRLDAAGAIDATDARAADDQVTAFQDRVAFEARNDGVDSPDRALNFTITHFLQVLMSQEGIDALRARMGGDDSTTAREHTSPAAAATVFVRRGTPLALTNVDVRRSPVCRQDSRSECWDVALVFFDPTRPADSAKAVVRATVDVSTSLPVVLRELEIQLMS